MCTVRWSAWRRIRCFISMRIRIRTVRWGKNIHKILDDKLQRVQDAMERELRAITLADVMEDLGKYIFG